MHALPTLAFADREHPHFGTIPCLREAAQDALDIVGLAHRRLEHDAETAPAGLLEQALDPATRVRVGAQRRALWVVPLEVPISRVVGTQIVADDYHRRTLAEKLSTRFNQKLCLAGARLAAEHDECRSFGRRQACRQDERSDAFPENPLIFGLQEAIAVRLEDHRFLKFPPEATLVLYARTPGSDNCAQGRLIGLINRLLQVVNLPRFRFDRVSCRIIVTRHLGHSFAQNSTVLAQGCRWPSRPQSSAHRYGTVPFPSIPFLPSILDCLIRMASAQKYGGPTLQINGVIGSDGACASGHARGTSPVRGQSAAPRS